MTRSELVNALKVLRAEGFAPRVDLRASYEKLLAQYNTAAYRKACYDAASQEGESENVDPESSETPTSADSQPVTEDAIVPELDSTELDRIVQSETNVSSHLLEIDASLMAYLETLEIGVPIQMRKAHNDYTRQFPLPISYAVFALRLASLDFAAAKVEQIGHSFYVIRQHDRTLEKALDQVLFLA